MTIKQKAGSIKSVSFNKLKSKKPLTNEERRRLLNIRDVDIDYSDIPQIPDNFADEAVRGLLYRPVKNPFQFELMLTFSYGLNLREKATKRESILS